MNSIIQGDKEHCFLCGGNGGYWGLDEHHVYSGANRRLSEKYGLKVYLCHDKCHLNGVHKDIRTARTIQAVVQRRAMQYYHWDIEQFIKIFGKNYL